MKFAFAAVVMLTCLGAEPATRPATRPARAWRDVRSLVSEIPDKIRPVRGEKWTIQQATMAARWLEKFAVGQRLDLRVKFYSAADHSDTAYADCVVEKFNAVGLDFDNTNINAEITLKNLAKIANYKSGRSVRLAGTVKETIFQVTPDPPLGSIQIQLTDASIE